MMRTNVLLDDRSYPTRDYNRKCTQDRVTFEDAEYNIRINGGTVAGRENMKEHMQIRPEG